MIAFSRSCQCVSFSASRSRRKLFRPFSSEGKKWKELIFSGIQPTGDLHIGNYFGAVKKWIEFQDEGKNGIYCIVDLHAITVPKKPKELKESIFKMASTLIACGIDPSKSILFQQSQVPYHTLLGWIFICSSTMSRLAQLPHFKEKTEALQEIPAGLFAYPTLQAADILLYKSEKVNDQLIPSGQLNSCRSSTSHVQLLNQLCSRSFSTSSVFRSEKVDDQLIPSDRLNSPSSLSSPIPRPGNLDNEFILNAPLDKLGIRKEDALDLCEEDVSDFAPPLQPTSTFAAYVNDSPMLQELVKLGVQLYRFEKDPKLCNYILSLDFDRDVKNHLLFLHEIGVPGESFGNFITKNPLIFREDLDNLKIRINYLESKRFTPDMICHIVTLNPNWLSFPTQEIDSRLGFFQQSFGLTGSEVRSITTRQPNLITGSTANVSSVFFSLKEEMGFTNEDIKAIIVAAPDLFLLPSWQLRKTFDIVHNEMGIPHELILKQPQVLSTKDHDIQSRHQYLKFLKRDQYDPKKENYVSLVALVSGSDIDFCKNLAKTSVESYNSFLKSL